MKVTTTGLIFRAGREVAVFDANALRTAEQAKRQATKKGQGRLQHQASMLVTAIRASCKTTAALEMVKKEIGSIIEDIGVAGDDERLFMVKDRLVVLLGLLVSGEIELPKPERISLWVRVVGFFSGRK